MKVLKLFLVLVFFLGCSKNENIKQFETVLGKENSETLTYLVEGFENDFLKKQYPELNTKKAYRQFLIDLRAESQDTREKFFKVNRNIFDSSTLKLEMYCVPDSVWITKSKDSLTKGGSVSFIRTNYICASTDDNLHTIESSSSMLGYEGLTKDSIVKIFKNRLKPNLFGKYSKALESMPNKSQFLENFIRERQSMLSLGYYHATNRMIYNNADFDDYFIKRLVITDIVY
ncbi:hypothetical protein N7U66_14640 [Lacinutrix neustonica]|uniref:Lipoprotein n=1 Tax=Lacinutrix neustonica TaxID=2980107 RepID=A0A9E8SG30_9FLAO|nr:hypothetical protein [Lacinutrix neustonica]WAC01310.1 hypothetical protein N7U66_14640 [Lacinutrix neustonica]